MQAAELKWAHAKGKKILKDQGFNVKYVIPAWVRELLPIPFLARGDALRDNLLKILCILFGPLDWEMRQVYYRELVAVMDETYF